MRKLFSSLALAAILTVSAVAANGASYSFFGTAGHVSPGNASFRAARVTSTSYLTDPNYYGGIDYSVPSGLTIAGLNNLSTDFKAVSGGCQVGSPRFVVETAGGGYLFIYPGTTPTSTCPADNLYHSSGNLVSPASLVETNGTYGFVPYMPYGAFQAIHGADVITAIYLVMDGGYGPGGTQVFHFDNTQVAGTLYTYEPPTPATANDCKNGGWQNLFRANGTPFKNQGDCIQYVNTGK